SGSGQAGRGQDKSKAKNTSFHDSPPLCGSGPVLLPACKRQGRWGKKAFFLHTSSPTTEYDMNIDAIPVGKNPPDDLNVIIEVPLGGEPIKYEIDKDSGALFVDRFLYTPMRYPGNYGFVPHTLCGDGDPLD